MARRVRFRPTLRQRLMANAAAIRAMTGGPLPQDLEFSLERIMPPEKKKRAAPRQLEALVIAAISELLHMHPRVIWAARFNSGAASYEAASGKYAPVWFHKFLRMPEPMRMPDFFGLITVKEWGGDICPLAIEAKAPAWTKPRDDREREQAAFLKMVRDCGGVGIFATNVDDVARALA